MDSDDSAMPLTLPDTQNADNLTLTQSQETPIRRNTPVFWGVMCPLKARLPNMKLEKDEYSLGRLERCDICLTDKLSPHQLSVISKIHFRITREYFEEESIVYLEDLSFNGTYVNDKLVGKGNKIVLDNNDIISLAQAQFAVYVFMSNVIGKGEDLPTELRTKYVVCRKLGAGACGEVRLVFTKDTERKRFAMKAIEKRRFAHSSVHNTLNDPDRIMNEVRILTALQHPYIIRTEEIVDTEDTLYIILELMKGGELFDRIREHPNGLSEACAKMIFYQVVLAVDYLHSRGITHRDLKPENILLASKAANTMVKVSDFGLSKFVDSDTMMRTFCGTPMYVAPEVLLTRGRGTYTSQVDIWSLGVILYTCLTGHVPFAAANKKLSLQEQIIKGVYNFPESLFGHVSTRATDLIKRMLTVDPKKRIKIKEVLVHPWLQDREMRCKVAELTRSNGDRHGEQPIEEIVNNNNKHVFDPPVNVAKRARRN